MNYFILYSIYSTLLYFTARLIVFKTKAFKLNRFLIIFSVLFAIVLPLISLPISFLGPDFNILLPTVEIDAQNLLIESPISVGAKVSISTFCTILYFIGLIIATLHFCFGLFTLSNTIRTGYKENHKDFDLIYNKKFISPCSFHKWVFIPENIEKETEDFKIILEHEKQHVLKRHSIDNVIFSILNLIFWFLPTSYYWARLVKLNHEFQVDKHLSLETNSYQYSAFLINQINQHQKVLLVHTVYSFTKKRIEMMYQQSNPHKFLIYSFTCFVLCSLLIFQSCHKQENIGTMTKENQIIDDDASISYLETISDTIITFDLDTGKEEIKYVSSERTIYNEADIKPQIKDCINKGDQEEIQSCSLKKILQTLYKNIKYPQEARTNKIEGMIISEFVISIEGEMQNLVIKKGLGGGTDEEVLRVLNLMQNTLEWTPGQVGGKDVNTKYTLPVKFKLQ